MTQGNMLQFQVIVAGGWNQFDKVQASVELFDIKENTWTELKNMPSPRVYFSLQVKDAWFLILPCRP